jgi:competence protein ComEC
MLYHFYTITPLTSIWTVLASPFIAVISILGYIKLLIGLLIPTAASILDIVIKPLSDLLVWLVKLFAGFNISEILIGRTNGLVIVLYYGFLFFTAFVYLPKPLLKKSIASVWVVSMFAFLIIAGHQIADRNNLVLTCLDVGHGQSILAQLPGGKNLLFDAGSLLKSNSGRRIIIPYLRFRGIDKLDAIIISHNDIDHINAIPEIVDDLKVDGVYANDDFFIDSTNSGAPKFLSDSLKTFGFEIQNLDKLQTSSPTDVKIIWPLEDVPDTNQLSDNDRSAVTLITYAGVNILLCSDIEKFAQQKILEFYPALKADIVVVPHHGSTATLDKDFLKSLDADVFICSGDIAQPQIRQFLPGDSRIFFTGTDGAVQVLIAPDGRTKIKEF